MVINKFDSVMPQAVEYAFSNSAPQAAKQLSSLEDYLDPITAACLHSIAAPQSGAYCLELGPGGGSVVQLLVGLAGPAGKVVAVDLDPSRLTPASNLEIVQHDLKSGLPMAGPFSLIHARLLLVHLRNRRELVRQLAAALAPGGWLVIGEFCFDEPLPVLAAKSDADATLFTRVVEKTKDFLVQEQGVELEWARQIRSVMGAAGLQRTKASEHPGTWIGGDAGCEMLAACTSQKHGQLLGSGLSSGDLQRFYDLMADPGFSCRSWPFVYTWGQKPPESSMIWVP